jgi:hypothetical protein
VAGDVKELQALAKEHGCSLRAIKGMLAEHGASTTLLTQQMAALTKDVFEIKQGVATLNSKADVINTVGCKAARLCAAPACAVLCCAVLCCAVLCCADGWHVCLPRAGRPSAAEVLHCGPTAVHSRAVRHLPARQPTKPPALHMPVQQGSITHHTCSKAAAPITPAAGQQHPPHLRPLRPLWLTQAVWR